MFPHKVIGLVQAQWALYLLVRKCSKPKTKTHCYVAEWEQKGYTRLPFPTVILFFYPQLPSNHVYHRGVESVHFSLHPLPHPRPSHSDILCRRPWCRSKWSPHLLLSFHSNSFSTEHSDYNYKKKIRLCGSHILNNLTALHIKYNILQLPTGLCRLC